MSGLFKILSVLPLWVLHGLGWILGWIAFLGSPTYRRRFLAHAAQAAIPLGKRLAAVGESGKLIAELPRLWMGSPIIASWEGREHLENALQREKGLLILTPHLGCFEVAAQTYARDYGLRRPVTVLFRPARKAWLTEIVARSRSRPGMSAVPTAMSGVKQLVRALKQGNCVGMLPDQVPPLGQGVWAPFFGRDAYTMTLSARLAQQTGATVLLLWGQRLSWGRGYVVHIEPLSAPLHDDLQKAAAQINQAMETLILREPSQYLWGYDRYKQPRESAAADAPTTPNQP